MSATRGALLIAVGAALWVASRVYLEGYASMGAVVAAAVLLVWGALDIRREPGEKPWQRALPLAGIVFAVAGLAARLGSEWMGMQAARTLDASLVGYVAAEPVLLALAAGFGLAGVATRFDYGVIGAGALVAGIGVLYGGSAGASVVAGTIRWVQYYGRITFFEAIALGPIVLVAVLLASREKPKLAAKPPAAAAAVSVPVKGPKQAPRKPA